MESISHKDRRLTVEPSETLSMHPKKFALWLFIVSILMIFAALSSAYMVRKGDGNWLEFEMPGVFWASSAILLVSSITLHTGVRYARKDELARLTASLVVTLVLGIVFIILQYMGWQDLQTRRIWLGGEMSNPAGSFVYVITGLHVFHLVTGIIFILITLIASIHNQIHAKAMTKLEMCATYWHFLDFLWIYILAFILLNR